MSPTLLPARTRQSGLQGRHVLVAMLGFFGAVFAVNGVLLYQALSTHSGLVANEPYRKGLHYNVRIEASERQQALGWTESVVVGRDGTIVVELRDSRGEPIRGLVIKGTVGRPSTVRYDRYISLREEAPGRYMSDVALAEGGAWLLSLDAHRSGPLAEGLANEPVYRLRRRLWHKPS